jgi:hypothetical protein
VPSGEGGDSKQEKRVRERSTAEEKVGTKEEVTLKEGEPAWEGGRKLEIRRGESTGSDVVG